MASNEPQLREPSYLVMFYTIHPEKVHKLFAQEVEVSSGCLKIRNVKNDYDYIPLTATYLFEIHTLTQEEIHQFWEAYGAKTNA